MGVDVPELLVRIARGEEERRVQAFMREHALRTHGCEPPESTGVLIGAWLNSEVVGSAVIDVRAVEEPFPLERLYGVKAVASLFPEGFDRTKIVQGGRWFSSLPGSAVSRSVARVFAQTALTYGAYAMFSEAKEYALRRMGEWGFVISQNPHARANVSLVPDGGKRYYQAPPLPVLFRIELESML